MGAKVQALNVGTNVAKGATTDERGIYRFSDLLPGVYNVTFETPGFKTLVQKGVRIDSNAVRRVDAQLEVSGVAETVEVVAAAAPLQTDRADIHVTQTARQVNDLPLAGSLGRNYQSLMQVVPGAVIVRTEAANGEANSTAGSPQRSISFSANGVSGWINQTKIDGSSPFSTSGCRPTPRTFPRPRRSKRSASSRTPTPPSRARPPARRSTWSSSRGRTSSTARPGATTRTATSGRATSSRRRRNNPKNIVAQYGGNVGGPIIKDKLFFFFNAEKYHAADRRGARQLSIAPESLRPDAAGDVVFPMPSAGGAIIYDPLSNPDPSLRTPFPNNTIPANRIDQAALYMLSQLPATERPGIRQQRRHHGRDHLRPHATTTSSSPTSPAPA